MRIPNIVHSLNNDQPLNNFPSLFAIDCCSNFEFELEKVAISIQQVSLHNINNVGNNSREILQRSIKLFQTSHQQINQLIQQIQSAYQIQRTIKKKPQLNNSPQQQSNQHTNIYFNTQSQVYFQNDLFKLMKDYQEQLKVQNQQKQSKVILSQKQAINYSQNITTRKKNFQIPAFTNNQFEFFCGCGIGFTLQSNFLNHIKQDHQSILLEGSSHIFIREKFKKTTKTTGLRILTKDTKQLKIKCPCNGKLMKRQKFIIHVIKKHKGFTPL